MVFRVRSLFGSKIFRIEGLNAFRVERGVGFRVKGAGIGTRVEKGVAMLV